MKKIKLNKKIVLTAITTILVLGNINFTVVSKTNSLFRKEFDDALAFNSDLKNIKKSDIITIEKDMTEPNIDNIILKVTFKRDSENAKDSNKKDFYNFIVPTSSEDNTSICSVVKVGNNLNYNGDTKDINFKTGTSENASGEVYLSCPTKDENSIGRDYDFKIKLYEHIDKEEDLLYAEDTYEFIFSEYAKWFEDIYVSFKRQLDEFIESYINQDNKLYNLGKSNFYSYIKTYGLEMDKIENGDPNRILNSIVLSPEGSKPIINGITGHVVHNDVTDKDEYVFDFTDVDLLGFVQMYMFYHPTEGFSRPESLYLYFAQNNISTNTLKKTLELMYPENQLDNANKVYEYIKGYLNKTNNDNYTIQQLKTIPGYIKTTSEGSFDMRYKASLLDNAHNFLSKDNKIKISYNKNSSVVMEEVFETALKFKKNQNIISNNLANSILASFYEPIGLYNAVINTNTTYSTYYELYQDGNIYKLIKAETNGEDQCNYISIIDLDSLNENEMLIKNYIDEYIAGKDIKVNSIQDLANIPGLILNTTTRNGIDYKYITFDSNIKDYANKYINGVDIIKIKHSTEENMILNFKNSIAKYDKSVRDSINTSISIQEGLYLALIDDTNTIETGYHEIHYDSNSKEFVLFSVISGDSSNYIQISKLASYPNSIDNITKGNIAALETLIKDFNENYNSIYLFLDNALEDNISENIQAYIKNFFKDYDYNSTAESYYNPEDINQVYNLTLFDIGNIDIEKIDGIKENLNNTN